MHPAATASKKQATEKVCEAHKQTTLRPKQVKAAQAKTEQYHLQREKEFQAKEAAVLGSQCSTEVEKTQGMTIPQNYLKQNRDEVLENLLVFVCNIPPEICENCRING